MQLLSTRGSGLIAAGDAGKRLYESRIDRRRGLGRRQGDPDRQGRSHEARWAPSARRSAVINTRREVLDE